MMFSCRTRAQVVVVAALLLGASGCGTAVAPDAGSHPIVAPLVTLRAPDRLAALDLLALRRSGMVELLDASTGQVLSILATGADPTGGLAERESLKTAYVTARGSDGRPAIWSIPLTAKGRAVEAVGDAELPSVSPDGGFLGYVTLDAAGRQDGVAITALGAGGLPVGPTQRLASTTVPPSLPITSLAVGRRDALLAVWGGFVDPYLGTHQPTVGTLVPDAATSLAQLAVLEDGSGFLSISPPGGLQEPLQAPKWHHTAPVYEPDGLLLIGSPGRGITLDEAGATHTTDGTIFPAPGLASDSLAVVSIAYGPDADLAFVTASGELEVAPRGAYLPYGPDVDPNAWMRDPPPAVPLGQGFTAVAWTPGPTAASTPPPKPWNGLDPVPDLVGMSLARATHLLDSLGVPEQVYTAPNATVAKGVVTSQVPPFPDGMACLCAVVLHVSSGPS
jgi:hypothetical protein